jgi:hypothetical protein
MAGKKGMHRLSARPHHRRTQPCGALAHQGRGNRQDCLEKHVRGKREMSATQVTAALGLLRKVVPDMAQLEHSGPGGEDVFAPLAEKTEALLKAWRVSE